jgi:hypothetical protein
MVYYVVDSNGNILRESLNSYDWQRCGFSWDSSAGPPVEFPNAYEAEVAARKHEAHVVAVMSRVCGVAR